MHFMAFILALSPFLFPFLLQIIEVLWVFVFEIEVLGSLRVLKVVQFTEVPGSRGLR